MDGLSAIPQQPQLGRLAQFLRYLETQSPEFLPKQLDVMGLVRQLALPQSSTVENLSYGNLPFTMPPQGTGALIPQVKTGRKPEVADLIGMLGGVPGVGAVSDVAGKLSNEAADAIVRAITRNPQATATGVIRETSMPFMQAVAPRTPGLLETPAKSELGFYSALEQATTPLQNKGTGAQFLAQIEKTAGVKPEEIKWTGLDEFLRNRETVTKAEVQDYLAQNRVNLQEVRLGEVSSPYPYRRADEWQQAIFDAERAGNWDEAARINQAWEAMEGFGPAGATKFSKYTLPGGENYREILLTLPQKSAEPIAGGKSPATMLFERDMMEKYKTDSFPSTYNQLSPNEIDKYEMLVREDRNSAKTESLLQDKRTNFRSSHFDQPNILAHMRVNDRVVDGKKTLFIEEIQSDWHQAGRKKGYGPQTETTHEAYYTTPDGQKVSLGFGKTQEEAAASVDPGWQGIVDIKFDTQTKKVSEGVPDAPFKTSWHELSLKRAIQEASEKGYDKIAFTTGKTQAERYDLSKQIDRIAITKTGGVWSVDAWKDGSKAITKDASTDADLANLVGKEIAEKAIKQGGGEYAGLDLKVGGEGMKGFYDNILPKSLEKLGKKFDAKVGKTEMDGVEVWSMDITPKMRESVLTKGQPLFATTPVAAGLLDDQNE